MLSHGANGISRPDAGYLLFICFLDGRNSMRSLHDYQYQHLHPHIPHSVPYFMNLQQVHHSDESSAGGQDARELGRRSAVNGGRDLVVSLKAN